MERPIYPNQSSIGKLKTRFFDNKDISEDNKKAVFEFLRLQESLGVGETRIRKLLSNFTTILTRIFPGFELQSANEDDSIDRYQHCFNTI